MHYSHKFYTVRLKCAHMHFYCSVFPLQVLDTYLRPKQHCALKCTIRSIVAVSKTIFLNRNPDYSKNYRAICTAQQQQGHRTFLFIYSAIAGTVANFLFALLASIFTLISTHGFHIFGSSIVSNNKVPAKKKGISKATNH